MTNRESERTIIQRFENSAKRRSLTSMRGRSSNFSSLLETLKQIYSNCLGHSTLNITSTPNGSEKNTNLESQVLALGQQLNSLFF